MDAKEQRIVEAAWGLIDRHGYRKVTMSDIAEAAGMSRPTLYASFANKEAVLMAFMQRQCERYDAETKDQLAVTTGLGNRLTCVFEIWIIQPFASVIDSPNGADLLANSDAYAPEAVANLYAQFEAHLAAVLRLEVTEGRPMSAEDIAHILMLATKGLKASTETLSEFQRMIAGLITMTTATVGVP